MNNHASTVGQGVHRQYVAAAPDKSAEVDAEDFKLTRDWSTVASLKNQLTRGPEYWKLDRIEVQVFDLSDPEKLAAYSALLTETSLPDTSKVLVQNDRQWSEKSGHWMACVEIQHILYRKILITEKNENEKAGSD